MTRRELLSLTTRRVLVLDGGTSTSFSNFGKDRQPPPEMALLEAFGEVVSIHRRYARAGADILLTNTFGANRVRLKSGGLMGQLEELNRRGVLAARRAADGRCLVAANMGPTGLYRKGRRRPPSGKVIEIFGEQAQALLWARPDLFVLETFADLREITLAIEAVRKVASLPLVALMTFDEGGKTPLGFEAGSCREACREAGADIVGVNCSVGARSVLRALRGMAKGYPGPLAAEPNAGLPRRRRGRLQYEESPSMLARYAESFVRLGVRLIGGCCGTTPAHISALRRALL